MKKSELNKNARRMILQEGLSHQSVFDELAPQSSIDKDKLAELIGIIPAKNRLNQNRMWLNAMVVILAIIVAIRLLSITLFAYFSELQPILIAFAVILGIVVPAVGIFATLTSRFDMYRGLGILIGLSILRSFKDGEGQEPADFLVLIPFVIAVVLAFYIPTRLKTNYKRVVISDEQGNKSASYQFEDETKISSSDLVDDI
mgnify:CR=1 FL=1